MPFTFSHPAIILPALKSRYFSATTLVAGSMAPDFEYFFRMSVRGEIGHTLAGAIYFDVPVALLLAFVFHRVVKESLVGNLPLWMQARLSPLMQLDFFSLLRTRFIVVAFSAWLGALAHIFWDAFTHHSGFFVRQFDAFYTDHPVTIGGTDYPLFFVLQHVSTVLGLVIILIYFYNLRPIKTVQGNKPRATYWLLVLGVTFVIALTRFAIKLSDLNLGTLIVVLVSGFCFSLVVSGIVWKRFKHS